MRKRLFLQLIAVVFTAHCSLAKDLPVFPGAQGFGSLTVAGSGRHLKPARSKVFHVSSLANSGPGTLRQCAQAKVPRICVFDITGTITLEQRISIANPYLTVAGETALAPGVTLSGAGIEISTHDVLLRHLAIRVGDDPRGPKPETRDGIVLNGAKSEVFNVVLDHLSVSWAVDENFSTYGDKVRDITLSHSIIAEGLYRSIHPDGPHSMGALIGVGSKRVSLHHNLFAHNNDRNPRQREDTSLEFVNNVVYNWGGISGAQMANPSDAKETGAETLLTFAGNVYLPGPNSPKLAPLYVRPVSKLFRVYVAHNVGPTRLSNNDPEWAIVANIPESPYRVLRPAFPVSGVAVLKESAAKEVVLRDAGSFPGQRQEIDRRIIEELRSGVGQIRDCVRGCERSAGGLKEELRRVRKFPLPKRPFGDDNGNGYTNIEEVLFGMAKVAEVGSD